MTENSETELVADTDEAALEAQDVEPTDVTLPYPVDELSFGRTSDGVVFGEHDPTDTVFFLLHSADSGTVIVEQNRDEICDVESESVESIRAAQSASGTDLRGD